MLMSPNELSLSMLNNQLCYR